MKKLITLAVLSAAFTAPSAFGALVTYNTSASFIASSVVGGTVTGTEAFGGSSSTLFTITNNPNGGSSISGGIRSTKVTNGALSQPIYSETITPIAGAAVTGGTLNGPLSAWGADFDIVTLGGIGQGLNAIINFVGGSSTTISNINLLEPSPDGIFFFGVTVGAGDPLITSVILQAANQNSPDSIAESFSYDNVLVKGAITSSGVPEPSTFGLMGAAMIGLGLLRRLRF